MLHGSDPGSPGARAGGLRGAPGGSPRPVPKPLNALINSQRERLRAWTHAFGRDIRFCLYNGNTPERLPSDQAKRHPNEVQDRRTLRDAPPPILVTNATILEYMLVRAVDAPIMDQSHGLLEWVVLDEAHTYIGSQAAELALLIRRVLHAFGVRPDEVRFVATSATIGDPQGEAGRHLRRFLGDVAGVGEDRVRLVAGTRLVPDLGPEPPPRTGASPLEDLEAIEPQVAAEAPAPDRFAALVDHPLARAIRRRFIDNEARHREQGRFERMHDRLRAQWRAREGRDAAPTAAVLDAQSTRASPPGGESGYDAGMKVKGRKRHLVVDTVGLRLAVSVTAASVQDRGGAHPVMAQAMAKYPSV